MAKKRGTKRDTIKELKTDLQLFSRLFIVSSARSLNLDSFFEHENQHYPPSLSIGGQLHPGDKAPLLPIFEGICSSSNRPDIADAVVFDGGMLVHLLKPHPAMVTFKQYSGLINNYVNSVAKGLRSKRIDITWDLYKDNSIKAATRSSRGVGVRRPNLLTKGVLPKDWKDYLKQNQNKTELFDYLASEFLSGNVDLKAVTNVGPVIRISNQCSSSFNNVSCAHMEVADGRIILILHVKDAVRHGAQIVIVRCADTDVVVLCVSFFHSLRALGLRHLWLFYGSGNNKRYIPAHDIAMALGENKSKALRGMHAFTDCDSVSFFTSKGKKTAYKEFDGDDIIEAFEYLASPGPAPTERINVILEEYTVQLYGIRDQECERVNYACKDLFGTENRPILLIPPTAAALKQHTLRAAYQAGQIWGRADVLESPPEPGEWRWKLTEQGWKPIWSTFTGIWQGCRELDSCGCSRDCETMRCICRKSNLPCTLNCRKCKGECSNKSKRFESADFEDEDQM